MSLPRWQFNDAEPEIFDAPYHPEEFAQVHRFCYVTVRVKVVALEDIFFRIVRFMSR
jgi:hypothetical protein